jgi:hypothetical protein
MYSKSCPRCLDRPIVFFGLEIEDLAAILSAACAIMVLVSPLLAVPVGMALFFAVRKLKQGKPPGYLFYLAYKLGLLGPVSGLMKVRHLIPIPFAYSGKRKIRLSPLSAAYLPADRKLIRGYWGAATEPAVREVCGSE